MSITKLLPRVPVAKAEHGDVLLELAYLMATADGRLVDAELDAYRAIVASIRGQAASVAEVSRIVERFGGNFDVTKARDRVRSLAPSLPTELRELAFKLAIGLALVDSDAHDAENELVGVLFESLGLAESRADALAAEVREALAGKA